MNLKYEFGGDEYWGDNTVEYEMEVEPTLDDYIAYECPYMWMPCKKVGSKHYNEVVQSKGEEQAKTWHENYVGFHEAFERMTKEEFFQDAMLDKQDDEDFIEFMTNRYEAQAKNEWGGMQ